MSTESLYLLGVNKKNSKEEWLFIYDSTEDLVETLMAMGNDEECALNWDEINDIIADAYKMEEKRGPPG